MKRNLSFILALLMVLAVFAGCSGIAGNAGKKNDSDSDITNDGSADRDPNAVYVAQTSSSDSDIGKQFAEKLRDRLGINAQVTDKTDKVSYIVGNGSDADELDVSFEGMEEGYIIRKTDDTVLILGGNDAAAEYAVEYFFDEVIRSDGSYASEEINISDKSYRRINKLTIAGRDISEYTVVIPDDADDCAQYASDELVKYVEKACGAKLNVVKKSETGGVSHAIELSIDPDGSLGNEGFTIKTDENGIEIIGGFQRGCLYGVYELLEKYIGYRFLIRDEIYLYEAEVKDIPAGIDDTQIPVFKCRDVFTKNGDDNKGAYVDKFTETTCVPRRLNKYNESKYGYASPVIERPHTYYYFIPEEGVTGSGPNPCLTSEENINTAVENVLKYIQEKLDAGAKIGVDLTEVSFTANDSADWCTCKECRKLIKAAGGSKSGPAIYITNIVARAVAEKYPGVKIEMFAYYEALRAPEPEVMKCEDNVVVLFACGDGCYNHLYSGKNCNPDKLNSLYNGYYTSEIENWAKICKEIRVWYYAVSYTYSLVPLPILYNLREDMQYCAENNATGIFTESERNNSGAEDITAYMLTKLYWNPYMTAEEYEEILTEFLKLYYGDGYVNILRYIHMWTEAGDMMGCFSCSGKKTRSTTIVSCEYYADNYSVMKELFDNAKAEANYKERKLLDDLFVHVDYLSLCYEYDRMEKGETDNRDEVMEKYQKLYTYLKDNNFILDRLANYYVLPDEIELDKNPCQSWYGFEYMTECK